MDMPERKMKEETQHLVPVDRDVPGAFSPVVFCSHTESW